MVESKTASGLSAPRNFMMPRLKLATTSICEQHRIQSISFTWGTTASARGGKLKFAKCLIQSDLVLCSRQYLGDDSGSSMFIPLNGELHVGSSVPMPHQLVDASPLLGKGILSGAAQYSCGRLKA